MGAQKEGARNIDFGVGDAIRYLMRPGGNIHRGKECELAPAHCCHVEM